jgi:antirestriction protein ArdC
MFKICERERFDRDGKPVKDTIPVMRDYVVFNAGQCVGLDPFQAGYVQPQMALDDRYDAAQATLDATGATIVHGGNRACYSPDTDIITMPSRWQFNSPEEYFQTAYHEAIHWSEKRLGWDRSDKENTYALGELVAEIGSCFLMGEHGLGTTDQAPPYLAHWLKAMQNDCRFIFTASAQASKAADFIMAFKGQPTPTSDQVEEFSI